MGMLTEPNQTLKREDLGDTFTIVDAKTCPFTTMVKKGGAPSNTLFEEPVDAYADPKTDGRPDGKDVESAELENPADQRGKVAGRVQWFLRGLGVGKVANTVPNVAGVGKGKEFAKGLVKKMTELKRDMEYTYMSTNDSAADNGTDGGKTRGVGKWVQTSAQGDQPVPAAFRPAAAQVVTVTAVTDYTEAHITNVLEAQFQVTGTKDTLHTFCTTGFKKQVTSWTLDFNPTTTELAVRFYNSDATDKTITQTVDVFEGDFGKVVLIPTLWINPAVDGNAPKQQAYALHMDVWETRNQQAPAYEELAKTGGGRRAMIDAISGLICLNPKGECKFALT